MKKVICVILFLCLAIGISACKETGEPDRTGSWGQINQQIIRSGEIINWKEVGGDDQNGNTKFQSIHVLNRET